MSIFTDIKIYDLLQNNISKLSILLALVIATFLAWQIPNLEFDYELENFFPLDDPDLVFYQDFSKKFGHDNDFLLVGIENSQGIFNQVFLQKIDSLTNQLNDLQGTDQAFSITTLKNIRKTPLGYIDIPMLHPSQPKKLTRDSINFYKEVVYKPSFISKSGLGTKVIILHEKFANEDQAKAYVKTVLSALNQHNFDKTYIAGKAKAQTIFVETVKGEFSSFLIFAMGLIIIMLFLYMKKPLLILITLSIAGITLASSLGIMSIMGKKIDLLTSLIPTILSVVTMSNIVHLFAKIREEILKSNKRQEAIKKAVKEVGFATILTTLTTAFGFFTLISIRVKPILELGIYTALGILMAYLFTYLIFPQSIILSQVNFSEKKINIITDRFLKWVFVFVLKKQKVVIGSFCIIILIILIGVSKININSSLLDDLPETNGVVDDFKYFNDEFEGTKPWSMSVSVNNESSDVYQKNVILEIEKIESLAKEVIGIGAIASPVTYVKSANRTLKGGHVKNYHLPDSDLDWKKCFKFINKYQPERKFIKVSNGHKAQLAGYVKEEGSDILFQRTKILLERLEKTIDHELISYQVTGTSHLIDKSHKMLPIDISQGLLLAIVLVAAIAGFLFKSVRMIAITIIPNIIPILATAAVMGYFGIDLNLGTSIIFAISFGIVVDDSIHFLSKFRIEKQKGLNHLYALKRTIISTGAPIIFTTIILTSGFLIFTISKFSGTFHNGLFVSISFTIALIADLFLLPVLILWFYKDSKR